MINHSKIEFKKIETLLQKGKFSLAYNIIIENLKENNLLNRDQVTLKLLMGQCFVKQGKFQEAIDIITSISTECERLGEINLTIQAFLLLTEIYWRMGKIIESKEVLTQCEVLLEGLSEEKSKRKGEYFHQKGSIQMRQGELDDALSSFQTALEYQKENEQLYNLGQTLNSIGVTYFFKGKLNEALKSYNLSIEFKEELGNPQQIAIAYNNIGDVYHTQGELKKAYEYYTKALDLFKESGNKEHIFSGYHNIGKFFHQKRDFVNARDYFTKAAEIAEESKNVFSLSENLFHQILVSLDLKDPKTTNIYLEQLQRISKGNPNKIIQLRLRVAQALVQKTTTRIKDRMTALSSLQSLIAEKPVNHELLVIAMLHTTELLLYELKLSETNEEEVLQELKNLASSLEKIAQDQQLHSLLAETYLLQSRLALIDLDIKRTKELLMTAQLIADERGLIKLASTIKNELELLKSQLNNWEFIIEQKPNVKDISALSLIDDLVQRMIRRKVYLSEREAMDYLTEAKRLLKTWEKT